MSHKGLDAPVRFSAVELHQSPRNQHETEQDETQRECSSNCGDNHLELPQINNLRL